MWTVIDRLCTQIDRQIDRLIYGLEAWTLRRREEEHLERTEMRMLQWILGLTLRDKKRSDDIRRILGVACIMDKLREARLRWFGHVQRREEEDCVRRILEADVRGQRSRGKQRKRWIDVVKYNMENLRVDLMDVENRAEWRRRTRVADPSFEGSTAWRTEREIGQLVELIDCTKMAAAAALC